MVFVDAKTEKTLCACDWPLPYSEAVVADIDYIDAKGLTANCALAEDEKAIVAKQGEDPRKQATSLVEQKGYPGEPPVLAAKKHSKKKIHRDRPVSVIKTNTRMDFQRLYDVGIALRREMRKKENSFEGFLPRSWRRIERTKKKSSPYQLSVIMFALRVGIMSKWYNLT
jgi:hypothetical protein